MSDPAINIVSIQSVIGAVLAAQRKVLKRSQSEVAEAVGVTASTWSRIETGESAMTVEQLALAAQALELLPSAVLQAAEQKAAELMRKGIVVGTTRTSAEGVAASGAIPLVGKSLSSVLGLSAAAAAGVAGAAVGVLGYQLANRWSDWMKERERTGKSGTDSTGTKGG
jgi:transcriptional regulator with XRE-family HTH domain